MLDFSEGINCALLGRELNFLLPEVNDFSGEVSSEKRTIAHSVRDDGILFVRNYTGDHCPAIFSKVNVFFY